MIFIGEFFSVHFLKEADWLIVLNDGKIEVQGSPTDLSQSGVDFAKLVGVEEEIANDENGEPSRKMSTTSTLSSKSSNSSSKGDQANDSKKEKEQEQQQDKGVQMEESSKGKVQGSVAAHYFKAGAHWTILVLLGFSFLLAQILASGADYWVSIW